MRWLALAVAVLLLAAALYARFRLPPVGQLQLTPWSRLLDTGYDPSILASHAQEEHGDLQLKDAAGVWKTVKTSVLLEVARLGPQGGEECVVALGLAEAPQVFCKDGTQHALQECGDLHVQLPAIAADGSSLACVRMLRDGELTILSYDPRGQLLWTRSARLPPQTPNCFEDSKPQVAGFCPGDGVLVQSGFCAGSQRKEDVTAQLALVRIDGNGASSLITVKRVHPFAGPEPWTLELEHAGCASTRPELQLPRYRL